MILRNSFDSGETWYSVTRDKQSKEMDGELIARRFEQRYDFGQITSRLAVPTF